MKNLGNSDNRRTRSLSTAAWRTSPFPAPATMRRSTPTTPAFPALRSAERCHTPRRSRTGSTPLADQEIQGRGEEPRPGSRGQSRVHHRGGTMSSADRIRFERPLQVPLRSKPPSQSRTTATSDHDTDVLDMKGAADLLHFTPSFLSKIINGKVAGTPPIPHIRVGRSRRFRRESVLKWLEDQETGSRRDSRQC
jgi:hypothetical protein